LASENLVPLHVYATTWTFICSPVNYPLDLLMNREENSFTITL